MANKTITIALTSEALESANELAELYGTTVLTVCKRLLNRQLEALLYLRVVTDESEMKTDMATVEDFDISAPRSF
jgi:hypothetical protein